MTVRIIVMASKRLRNHTFIAHSPVLVRKCEPLIGDTLVFADEDFTVSGRKHAMDYQLHDDADLLVVVAIPSAAHIDKLRRQKGWKLSEGSADELHHLANAK